MTTLRFDDFQIELNFLGKLNKSIYRYTFYDLEFSDEPLFVGSDFELSPMVEDESVEAIAHLLAFLSCDRSSVESGYFDNYSDRQLDWLDSWSERVELLQCWQAEIEELADIVDEMFYYSNYDDSIDWSNEYLPITICFQEDGYGVELGQKKNARNNAFWVSSELTEGMSESECLGLAIAAKECVIQNAIVHLN